MNNSVNRNVSPRMLMALGAFVVFGYFFAQSRQPTQHQFDVKSVAVTEAKALIDAGALVIDVREQKAFDNRHIPGAILLPLAVLRIAVPATIEYAMSKPVVVYCGDGVTTGPEATQILNKAGFGGAVNVKAGIEGWAQAGLAVAK